MDKDTKKEIKAARRRERNLTSRLMLTARQLNEATANRMALEIGDKPLTALEEAALKEASASLARTKRFVRIAILDRLTAEMKMMARIAADAAAAARKSPTKKKEMK